jgi:hypothetical protein
VGVGLASLTSLMALTFLQPQLGVRFVIDLLLAASLFWAAAGK